MSRLQTDATGKILVPAAQQQAVEAGTATLEAWLGKLMPSLEKALPRHLTADRFARIALTVVRTTPKMEKVTPVSFCACVLSCAYVGLEPGTAFGHAYLIPRENKRESARESARLQRRVEVIECTLTIGYQGMVEIASRADVDIDANVVREGDEFEYWYGLNQDLVHRESKHEDREERPITYAYAIARHPNRSPKFKVLSRAQIDSRRARAATDRFWIENEEAMSRKSPIRALWPLIPKTDRMSMVGAVEDVADRGGHLTTIPEVGGTLDGLGLRAVEEVREDGPAIVPTEEAEATDGDSGSDQAVRQSDLPLSGLRAPRRA